MALDRRCFIGLGAETVLWVVFGGDEVYPGWKPGELDIHFIQTGVGEQTFFIFPDGTTMLLDCGDGYNPNYLKFIPRRPSEKLLGGEWVSRYVQRLVSQRTIDYFVLSHWHGDHCGSPSLRTKTLPDGCKVCGIALFAEDFNIRHYFDHQWPRAGDYVYDLDKRGMAMVREWTAIHKADLLNIWETQEFKSLSPLE